MGSTLRTFLARAEIMFVLLAMIVFVCWQQHRAAQREEAAFLQAVEAARQEAAKQEEAALKEKEDARWRAHLHGIAKNGDPESDRTAPPPHEK